MKFIDTVISSLETSGSHVCVGLDSRFDKIPDDLKKGASVSEAIFSFNKRIIEATHDLAAAYKSNVAFYAGFGPDGLEGLRLTNTYLRTTYPGIPVFADCKRSEMGESVTMIKNEIFDWLQFTCIMVTPWFGFDTVRDYLTDERHGICVYAHDSNPTAAEFQELELKDGSRVYEAVTKRIVTDWNKSGNVMVEAGATYPEALRNVRSIIGEEMPLLVAGVGTQGGSVDSLKGLFGANGRRLLVNSSRGIIFAGLGKPDYFSEVRKSALTLRDALRAASTA